MPRTYSERSVKHLDSVTLKNGVPIATNWSSALAFKSYVDRPAVSRRPFPSDLWLAQTPRRFLSLKWGAASELIRVQTNNPYSQTINVPPSYWSAILDYPKLDVESHRLANELLGKIKDQKVNLGESLPELGKTTDMVANLARDVVRAFHQVRSGRPLHAFKRALGNPRDPASKRAAKRWLEYVYGWAPLMSEIYGLSEWMHQEISEGYYIYERVRRRYTYSQVYTPTAGVSCLMNLRGYMSMKARFRVDDKNLRSLSQIGISNPALTAWELLPYSFVFDWIIDVSGYLSGLDALNGLTDVTYCHGFVYDSYYDITELNTNPSWKQISQGKSVAKGKVSNRSGLLTGLKPLPPRYEPHLTVKRMVSAVALIRNLF